MTNTERSDDKHRVEIHIESIESSTSSTLNPINPKSPKYIDDNR